MLRGKKQGLWVGRRVPEVDEAGVPILYPRYARVEELLAPAHGGGEAKAAAAAEPSSSGQDASDDDDDDEEEQAGGKGSNGAAKQTLKQADKEEQQQQQQDGKKKKEKKKKKDKDREQEDEQQQQQQQQQPDGHTEEGDDAGAQAKRARVGNADEARHLRSVFGFEGSDTAGRSGAASGQAPAGTSNKQAAAAAPAAAPPTAAPAAAAASGGGGKFAFGFDAQVAAQVEAETDLKLARLKALDAADKDGYVPRRVFVGGMPYGYTREQVHEYWSWCGAVKDLDLLTFPDTGRFRGIAFITFADDAGYEAALACDGEALDGQTLKVDRCKAAAAVARRNFAVGGGGGGAAAAGHHQQQQQQQQAPSHEEEQHQQHQAAPQQQQHAGAPAKAPGYNVAYVGNIAFEATREELAGVFRACGVKLVRLHTDQATGRSKGYAHVHFEDEAGLDRALALDGHVLRGRAIRVSYGQPKKA